MVNILLFEITVDKRIHYMKNLSKLLDFAWDTRAFLVKFSHETVSYLYHQIIETEEQITFQILIAKNWIVTKIQETIVYDC
jgi:hypothetical protein